MAEYPMTLQVIFDDVLNTLTFVGSTPAPEPPDGVPMHLWFPQVVARVEFTALARRALGGTPVAYYVIPNSDPVEWRKVEFRNGRWQMPGTVVVRPD